MLTNLQKRMIRTRNIPAINCELLKLERRIEYFEFHGNMKPLRKLAAQYNRLSQEVT